MRYCLMGLWFFCAVSLAISDLDRLEIILSKFSTLQANFTQEVRSESGREISHDTGQMRIKKPGKFFWVVSAPNAQEMIADGQFLWLYDPDLEQVTKKKEFTQDALSPATLLSGSVEYLQKEFQVQAKTQENLERFILIPKSDQASFTQVELIFKEDRLFSIVLKDALGQKSVFQFSQVKLNASIPDWQFQFKPPPGVDVLTES